MEPYAGHNRPSHKRMLRLTSNIAGTQYVTHRVRNANPYLAIEVPLHTSLCTTMHLNSTTEPRLIGWEAMSTESHA